MNMPRINSKSEFNEKLNRSYPTLSIRCRRFNAFLNFDVDLIVLAKLISVDVADINLMRDVEYYNTLNVLYDHIEENEHMIEWWLL